MARVDPGRDLLEKQMQYHLKAEAARLPAETVDLKALARSELTQGQKAEIASDIAAGCTIPTNFSQKKAAELVGCSPSYVSKKGGNRRCSSLASQLLKASAAERAAAALEIGIDEVWNTMIEPLVG
jgi:hypothetical protein